MNLKQEDYYKDLFYNLTFDEIVKWMPEYIKIIQFDSILKFREYCITNNINIESISYGIFTVRDLFCNTEIYIIINTNESKCELVTKFEHLKYKVFHSIVMQDPNCKFIESQVPFDNETYRKELLSKAIDIITNDFDENDLQNFITDNT